MISKRSLLIDLVYLGVPRVKEQPVAFGRALLVRGDPATGLAAWLGPVLGMKEYGAFLIESPKGGRSRATLALGSVGRAQRCPGNRNGDSGGG